MIAIKKDFVSPDTLSYCNNRRLSSGKAYFLLDSNGNIVKAGKQCAMEHSQNDLKTIPDLTTSLIANYTQEGRNSSSHSNSDRQEPDKKAQALTYLLLRQEILVKLGFKGVSYPKFESYYEEYKNKYDLSYEAIEHIYNVQKSRNTPKKFSLPNLLTCYAYYYKMQEALRYINNKEGQSFVESLLEYLKKYCDLKENQINGLSKWFQYIDCRELREAKLKSFER